MAVTFKESSSTTAMTTTATSTAPTVFSSVTFAALTNGLGIVATSISSGVQQDPSTVSWGSSAMTKLNSVNHIGLSRLQSLWYVVAPPTGTQSITATFASTGSGGQWLWITFEGVDQTTPNDVPGGATSYNASVSNNEITATINTANTVGFSFALCENNLAAGTPDANTTVRINDSNAWYGQYSSSLSTGSQTFGSTGITAGQVGVNAIYMKAFVATTATTNIPQLLSLKVG